MSKEDFETLLNRLLKQLESENTLPANKLSVAVEYWCEELGISEDVKKNINEWIDKNKLYEILNIPSNIARIASSLGEPFKKIATTIEENLFSMPIGRRDDTYSILLVSLILVSLGLLQHYSNRKSLPSSKVRSQSHRHSEAFLKIRNHFLLLVVNAKHEELVERLTSNYRIEKYDCEMLHRATQALWMGSEENFPEFNSGSWFPRGKVSPTEFSEYDVYFLKIRLKQQDKGFEQNANQIDRLDAFLGLIQNCIEVEASPRLSSKSYGNEIFYSR